MNPPDYWFYYENPLDPRGPGEPLPLWPGLPTDEDVAYAKEHGFVIRILDKANGGW